MIPIIISFLVFFGFIVTMIVLYGVQPSVSAYYYCLPVNRQFIFTGFCTGFSVPLLYLEDSVFISIAVMCVLAIGAAAAYKGDELISSIHKICAVGMLISSQLYFAFSCGIPYESIIFVAVSGMLYLKKVPSLLLIMELGNYLVLISVMVLKFLM